MPVFKQKLHDVSPSPKDLLPDEEVFVIPETKECFRSYDEYIGKLFLYNSHVWSCQYTGQRSMTFKDALASENKVLKQLVDFPDCFKRPVLNIVHQGKIGILHALVDLCCQNLKSEYFLGEEVYVRYDMGRTKKVLGPITSKFKNPDESDTENATETKIAPYYYSVQITSNMGRACLKHADILRRNVKVPSKELLRIFIRTVATKCAAKDMWVVKDEFIKKYKLDKSEQEFHKTCVMKKSPSRAPLHTIGGPNSTNAKTTVKAQKHLTKKSPKNDPTQKTLNFFLPKKSGTTAANTTTTTTMETKDGVVSCTTPSKNIKIRTPLKNKDGTPTKQLVAELEICLDRSLDKKKRPKQVDNNDPGKVGSRVKVPVRTIDLDGCMDHTAAVMDQSSQAVRNDGNGKICVTDDDELEITGKSPKVKENYQKMAGNNVKQKQFNRSLMSPKTTGKKQKTLSEMFSPTAMKNHVIKSVEKDESEKGAQLEKKLAPQKKIGVTDDKPCDVEHSVDLTQSEEGFRKELREDTDIECKVRLPIPKPVVVPEELKPYYGDILMVNEFMYTYGPFICTTTSDEDAWLMKLDDFIKSLTSTGAESKVYTDVLISFVSLLFKHYNDKEKLSELGVNMLAIALTKESVGEITRLYLKDMLDQQKADTTFLNDILKSLEEKDLVNLKPEEKIQILVYLLDSILQSDVCYDHVCNLYIKKKRDLNAEKTALNKEIKELKELKESKMSEKQGHMKNYGQIHMFMVNNGSNVEKKDKGPHVGDGGDKLLAEEHGDEVMLVDLDKKENHYDNGQDIVCSIANSAEEKAEQEKMIKQCKEEITQIGYKIAEKRSEFVVLQKRLQKLQTDSQPKFMGFDRNHSRYWLMPSQKEHLFVEKIQASGDDDSNEDGSIERYCIKSNEKRCWYYFDEQLAIRQLLVALDQRGFRESSLKTKLQTRIQQIKKLSLENKKTNILPEDHKEPIVVVKEELLDLGSRLTKGHMCEIEDHQTWENEVSRCSNVADLVLCGIQLGHSIPVSKLSKTLQDPTQWLEEQWTNAVQNAQTLSRFHLCVLILDSSIRWDECTYFMKCKICRATGGSHLMVLCDLCRKGYHVSCLRPSLDEVPASWECPCCKPPVNRRHRAYQEEVIDGNDHEESTEYEVVEKRVPKQANKKYCHVCCQSGDLVGCGYCSNSYHRACHDPPMRNKPRGFWKCCCCLKKPVGTVLKGDKEYASSEPSSDEEYQSCTSENELTSVWHSKWKKKTRVHGGSQRTAEERYEARKSTNLKSCFIKSQTFGDDLNQTDEDSADDASADSGDDNDQSYDFNVDSVEEDDSNEDDVSEDCCHVCGKEGQLVCCDTCPKVYHKECHDPPLRNVPRGSWQCGKCRKPVRVASRKRLMDDSSDEDGEPIKKTRQGKHGTVRNGRRTRSNRENSPPSRKRKIASSVSSSDNESVKRKTRQDPDMRKCELLLKDLVRHEESWPFLEPVDLTEVPDYLELVTCPMDFATIRNKLENLDYPSYTDFLSDVRLVFDNSDTYNMNTTDYGVAGLTLSSYFEQILPKYFPRYQTKKTKEVGRRSKRRKS